MPTAQHAANRHILNIDEPISTDTQAPTINPTPAQQILAHYPKGSWVAQFDCGAERPVIAQVRDAYADPVAAGAAPLLDLVIFNRNGTRIGRQSPGMGGPRSFEPACSSQRWERIQRPDFSRMSEERHHWGHHLIKVNPGA